MRGAEGAGAGCAAQGGGGLACARARAAAPLARSPSLTRPPSHTHCRLFDFNLTLPIMAAEILLLMVFLDKASNVDGRDGRSLLSSPAPIRARAAAWAIRGGLAARRLAGEGQRVAHKIAHAMEDFRRHVIVRQDDGILLPLQPVDLGDHRGIGGPFDLRDDARDLGV